MSQIPLYEYQVRVSDEMVKDIINQHVKYNIYGERLNTEFPIIQLKSPLGSGKTRMMVRTVFQLSKNKNRYYRNKRVVLDNKEIYNEKTKINGKIIITVPVSVIPQWIAEMNLWNLKYFVISTPKELKNFSDIHDIYLISELRMNEILKTMLDFIKDAHLFVDEIDTIRVPKLPMYRCDFTSMTVCSANTWIRSYYDKNLLHEISQKEVDDKIKLPDIIESKISFNMGLTLKKLIPYVLDSVKTKIENGDFKSLFDEYKVSRNRIDLLIKSFISENESKIKEHKALPSHFQSKSFLMKMEYWNKELSIILEKDWNSPISELWNCNKCFAIIDRDLLNGFGECLSCSSSLNSNSRIGVLDQILDSIDIRPGRSKKVLIYCSSNSLVSELQKHIEKTNIWTIGLQGSVTQRAKTIDKYKKAEEDIFLVCNSIENSAGIHLPETTDIIIYHKLEDKYDTQIIGRGQRLGRFDSMYLHRIEALI